MSAFFRRFGFPGLVLSCFLMFTLSFSIARAQSSKGAPVPSAMPKPTATAAPASSAKPQPTVPKSSVKTSAAKPGATPAAPVIQPFSKAEETSWHMGTPAQKGQSFLGLLVLTGICFVIGQVRNSKIKPMMRTVVWGLFLQFVFALVVFRTPGFFDAVNKAMDALLDFSKQGGSFLFGNLASGNNVPVGQPAGAPAMGPILHPTAYANVGSYFAFNVLPTIIFFSALSTLFYYLGVLQPIVKGLSWVMQRTMGTSGSETLSGVANIFLGQTEAPLFVRPFIATCTKSELMAIMVGGFSNIASGVLGAYTGMLVGFEPNIAGYLLSSSIISAPASLVVAKLLMPESEPSETMGTIKVHVENTDANVIDATARGAIEGLELALNVGAMLMVFVAVVAMLNAGMGWIGHLINVPDLSLQMILGYIFSPIAWLLGIPWEYCTKVGSLLGIKTVLSEFNAYLQLSQSMGSTPGYLDHRSFILCAYGLCGFANFSSIAIQIGGIGSMAPERRGDLSRMGMTAMIGGAIATCMTACVVGVLL